MKWETFLERFGAYSLIEPQMVYVGEANPQAIQAQLSRWVKARQLIKLVRGKYGTKKRAALGVEQRVIHLSRLIVTCSSCLL